MAKFHRIAKQLIGSIADAGEGFMDYQRLRGTPDQKLLKLSEDLISQKGIASGVAFARLVVNQYQKLDGQQKLKYFKGLAQNMGPDYQEIKNAAVSYLENQDEKTLNKLSISLNSRRRELFIRMNMAPDGTLALVDLRKDLLSFLTKHPELKPVDDDLKKLLTEWFNPGFLELRRIDWDTEASILEKIIRYETVHNIENWSDLKQRLVESKRCFAYFHPALEDEPLIFVEVALTKGISKSVQDILHDASDKSKKWDSAIFYSINNCQLGLRGIPLGNFLIKMAATEIAKDLPNIKRFSSLSPVPGFSQWLIDVLNSESKKPDKETESLKMLLNPDWTKQEEHFRKLKKPLKKACARYLVEEKNSSGQPLNSVARFHFGNGAELYRINWMGNISPYGLERSFGLMVNYLYDLKHLEENHENYVRKGELAISKGIRGLLSK